MRTRNPSTLWYMLVCRNRNDAKLLHHTQIIPHRSMLYPLAVPEAHEMHLGLPQRATGRSLPHKGALMGPAHRHTAHNRVPLGHQFLDREVQVGKGGAQHRDYLARRLGTTIVHSWRNLVIDTIGCDQFVCNGEVALVEHFLIGTAKDCLVFCFCCCHGFDSFAYCFISWKTLMSIIFPPSVCWSADGPKLLHQA